MQRNVYEWLLKTAERFPDKPAVFDEHGEFTFSELGMRSRSLGRLISERLDGQIRMPVAVYIENCKDAILAFLSIVYSGNFYVPIDKEMPFSRIHSIFDTLNPVMVLCKNEDMEKVKTEFYNIELLGIDDDIYHENGGGVLDGYRPYENLTNEDILYVLFTSGSTGVPKGVAIPHKGVINYIDWVTECFSITEEDCIGNQAPFYFDNSVLDIYSMLKTGASLYITPHILFSQPVPLLEYIRDKNISTIFWVPSALVLVARLRALKNVDMKGILKKILFAGEVMPVKQLNYWRKNLPDVLYANLYGPTEITVDCTYYILDRDFLDDEAIPIGKAIPNAEVIVLDEENNLITELDRTGELCVKGAGLAAGYYNNPEKTAEVFVQNPLNHMLPEMIYRTGDLVKYNEHNELIYVSRKDFQIKHMGHRIELGEIEQAACSIGKIETCCCVYDEIKKRIVFFVENELDKNVILEELKERLPKYMLPSDVICLDRFPLTQNGKINRLKLKEYL